jgi:DNA-binding NarL/FixJ family response regulator
MISVAIIEDHRDIREAICDYLDSQSGFSCVLNAESVEQFLKQVSEENMPDIVLCDIGLPGMSGIEGIRFIKERFPEVDVVMLTVYDDAEKIFQSLCAGASGYLLKNTPFSLVKEGLELLNRGGAPMSPEIAAKVVSFFQNSRPKLQVDAHLTEKEREVVVGLVDGLSYKMIADRLSISVQTVQVHIKNIYQKLHVHCKAEVIAKSFRGEL